MEKFLKETQKSTIQPIKTNAFSEMPMRSELVGKYHFIQKKYQQSQTKMNQTQKNKYDFFYYMSKGNTRFFNSLNMTNLKSEQHLKMVRLNLKKEEKILQIQSSK